MQNMKSAFLFAITQSFMGLTAISAKTVCPEPVKAGALKTYPAAKISSCKQEKENGKIQYEVRLKTGDERKLELDIDPEGAILLTEEKVAAQSVPKAALSAFEAKYPRAKVSGAEKQTKPDGTPTYELAFKKDGKSHEATFDEQGRFVEEE